jgi:hypothetical protein
VIDQAGIELAHVFRRSEAFAFARDRGARVHLKGGQTDYRADERYVLAAGLPDGCTWVANGLG